MPTVGDDEVLVRVHAAGVDPGVLVWLYGKPAMARPASGHLPAAATGARPGPRRPRRGGRQRGDAAAGRRRGLGRGDARGVRRVRRGRRGAAGAQAGRPDLRAGGRRTHLRDHRAAGAGQGRRRGRHPGARQRRVRWRRQLRGPARQGPWRGGHRGLPAPAAWTWSGPWGPTTSSTTRARTSPVGAAYDVIMDLAGSHSAARLPPGPGRRAARSSSPADRRPRSCAAPQRDGAVRSSCPSGSRCSRPGRAGGPGRPVRRSSRPGQLVPAVDSVLPLADVPRRCAGSSAAACAGRS